MARKLEPSLVGSKIRYEYSPESFTLTEPEYALDDLPRGHGRDRADARASR